MEILEFIFIHGFIYSLVLSLIISLSQLYNPRLWLQDYPEDIQNKVSPKTSKEKKLSLYVGIPFLLFMFLYPFIVTYYNIIELNAKIIFLQLFGIEFFFNLIDLLVLDWLIFTYITPKYLKIPGFEEERAYKNYIFHVKGFYIGTILSIIYGLIFSLVIYFLKT